MEDENSSPLGKILNFRPRSPLKDINFNARSSFFTSNTSAVARGSTNDMLIAKIEHLERDRIDLSLKIHQKDEKDRTAKLRIEQLELELKISQQARTEMSLTNESLKQEMTTLNGELKKMNKTENPISSEMGQGGWSKLMAASRELRRVEDEAKAARQDANELRIVHEQDQKQIIELTHKSCSDDKTIRILTRSAEDSALTIAKFVAMSKEYDSLKDQHQQLVDTSRQSLQSYESIISELRTSLEVKQAEWQVLQAELQSTILAAKEIKSDHPSTIIEISSNTSACIEELRQQLLTSEAKRKLLHNTLQELRGNIRVFVRCRPFLKMDKAASGGESNDPESIRCNKDGCSISLCGAVRGSGQTFQFDQVFNGTSSQEDVYKEITGLIQSSLDGYRVCIFSYGQTGSGKTHTMTGERAGSMRGIVPRSVEQVINEMMQLRSRGWTVTAAASMVELYNEELRDLLVPPVTNSTNKLKINAAQGRITVAGLTSVVLQTESLSEGMSQLNELLDLSSKYRATACTGMNEQSSRSHMVFMLEIHGVHSDGVTHMCGGLRLCDLAGSERLDRTGTLGDSVRLKETVNINKSLSCLADVFTALGNKAPHIPFRNSKLTMLLQDCLSGDGKALMFVNISPTHASVSESLCSIRFANQVSQIELGKAQKSIYTAPALPPPPPLPSMATAATAAASSTCAAANTSAGRATSSKNRRLSSNYGQSQHQRESQSQSQALDATVPATAPELQAAVAESSMDTSVMSVLSAGDEEIFVPTSLCAMKPMAKASMRKSIQGASNKHTGRREVDDKKISLVSGISSSSGGVVSLCGASVKPFMSVTVCQQGDHDPSTAIAADDPDLDHAAVRHSSSSSSSTSTVMSSLLTSGAVLSLPSRVMAPTAASAAQKRGASVLSSGAVAALSNHHSHLLAGKISRIVNPSTMVSSASSGGAGNLGNLLSAESFVSAVPQREYSLLADGAAKRFKVTPTIATGSILNGSASAATSRSTWK